MIWEWIRLGCKGESGHTCKDGHTVAGWILHPRTTRRSLHPLNQDPIGPLFLLMQLFFNLTENHKPWPPVSPSLSGIILPFSNQGWSLRICISNTFPSRWWRCWSAGPHAENHQTRRSGEETERWESTCFKILHPGIVVESPQIHKPFASESSNRSGLGFLTCWRRLFRVVGRCG